VACRSHFVAFDLQTVSENIVTLPKCGVNTLAREQASQEALIFRAFDTPFKALDMMVISGPAIMSSIGGDRD